MKRRWSRTLLPLLFLCLTGCQNSQSRPMAQPEGSAAAPTVTEETKDSAAAVLEGGTGEAEAPEGFRLIPGGTFQMGSPDSESWRSEDEAQHTVTVSDFYMGQYEVTQAEYEQVMESNPSHFSGENLPVENMTWMEAIAYCNARSEAEGLEPVYAIEGQEVAWDRSANGYRLPTEAEWEYACRAGTVTPFNTETSISAEEANYYGHYPYEIEENYFSQEKLETRPGLYRETTTEVVSFSPNAYGLYDMHGNVGEWVWDYYGAYETADQTDPSGPERGSLRVYRGGGWNDFAKNMRSAYRATLAADQSSFSVGIRLVRNASAGTGGAAGSAGAQSTAMQSAAGTASMDNTGNILIAYFSWSGNTEGIAQEIQSRTGGTLFEITPVTPYSDDYNTVLEEAQRDQNRQARPELASHVENMEQYDTVLIGYPNWWASIPMPVASFLEEYDFSGKTVIPFCSHGGGRFGQSLTAITKLVPDAVMGEPLSIHYSGGAEMPGDVEKWLAANNIAQR